MEKCTECYVKFANPCIFVLLLYFLVIAGREVSLSITSAIFTTLFLFYKEEIGGGWRIEYSEFRGADLEP